MRTYARIMVALALMGLVPASSAEDNSIQRTLTVKGSSGGHRYVVAFSMRPFVRKGRRIQIKSGRTMIDGQFAVGTDGNIPREELTSLSVQVDGTRWVVPRRLWRDCFELRLDDVQPTMTKDGKHLTITAGGSDGAGTYGVTWYLRSNGRHTRKVERDEG